ncbi:uncharacterized protein BDR25DRAFT_266432 [Lindgomyces ingoldianus]|uniref:Uncharacterized protein n=1 Tax=Lindgomyces ingoldianus TaxID=673940 RepID=A0ACB6QPC3_9PLEO|nr:uncharacterized protein BDR25DRAFT_266432 [Lindgomyces ingoldianus]KAF2467960.1 hypothetical protein BDR25DRAFT_266432 [Lindgomyces ingoldianus]
MSEELQDQPLEYRGTPPPVTRGPPPLPPTTQSEPNLRRPSPYTYVTSSLSSHSRFSSVASPRSLTSSRTSYSAGEVEQNHINIGIDFGTTYSGVAWAISGAQEPDINVVTTWPNAPTESWSVKVPTEIWYKEGEAFKWGYSVPPEAEPLKWFKLLLIPDAEMPQKIRDAKEIRTTKRLLQKLGKSLEDVIADYLQRIWECALIDIKQQQGSSADSMPLRIIMTVPASWTKDARNQMKSAAIKAGLLSRRIGVMDTKFEFVGEPEAAALAAFFDGNVRRSMNAGDIITICDAGGGTVDTVTYEIERILPNVHLGECIAGDSDLCGATALDGGFQEHMDGMMGKDKLSKMTPRIFSELMYMWEHNIKRQYQNSTSEIVAKLPHEVAKTIKNPLKIWKKGNGSKQLVGDAMRYTSADIKKIFDPVMRDILTLTNRQITETLRRKKKKPKAILLVGGLGSNKFLYQRLHAEYSTGDVDLIQPQGNKAWASICRGAAIKGMTFDNYDDGQVMPVPMVTSYISKAHYGIVFKVPFDASKHPEEDRRFDQATNQDLAYNQMQWYVSKGDDVSQGNPVILSWQKFQPDSRPCTSLSVKIFECEANNAPNRMTSEVQECETIIFPINWASLAVSEGANGQRFRRVQFDLKMTMLGLGKLDFETFVDGKMVARQNVRVKVGDGGLSMH